MKSGDSGSYLHRDGRRSPGRKQADSAHRTEQRDTETGQWVSKRRGLDKQHCTASTWSLVQGIPEEDNPKDHLGL